MRRYRWLMAMSAVAAVALIAACGGSSSKDQTPTSVASNGTQAKSTSAATSSSGNNSGGGGGVPDVTAITKKFAEATFQATYKVTGSGAEGGGEMLLYKDGQNRFRFDITATQNGQPMSIIFIQKDDTSAFCLKDAGELAPLLGVDAGKGVCFKSNANDPNNPVGSLSTTFSDIENADVTVLETSKRKVAGQDAACYRAKDNASGEISTICFADNGAMLYVQTEGTDANTIEATDSKSSVDASVFELPYEVKDFPGIGGAQ